MECGGTLGHFRNTEPVGLRSATAEMRNIDRVAALGGTMHYLDMDGPISRTLWSGRHRFDHKRRGNTGYDNIDKCVEELITYMKLVNRRYPDLKFFTLTNFPNWGWKGGTSYHSRHENNQDWGDYYDVISTLLREAKKAGVTNLVGVTVDSPYPYTIGRVRSVNLADPSQVDWIARLRDLEDYVESQGMELNLIVNSVERLEVDAKTYCEETLALIDLFRESRRHAKTLYRAKLGAPSREHASRVRSGFHDRPDEGGHHEGEGRQGPQPFHTEPVNQNGKRGFSRANSLASSMCAKEQGRNHFSGASPTRHACH